MKIDAFLKLHKKSLPLLKGTEVHKLLKAIVKAQKDGRTIFMFGNGGSGSNATHIVQDLLKCPVKNFDSANGRFKAMCLNDNIAVMTAYANDVSYEEIFRQQLMNFCKRNDLVIGLSGSGKSKNVIRAFEYGNKVGAHTFAVVGYDGGDLKNIAKDSVHIATHNMQIYEELAFTALHAIVTELKAH